MLHSKLMYCVAAGASLLLVSPPGHAAGQSGSACAGRNVLAEVGGPVAAQMQKQKSDTAQLTNGKNRLWKIESEDRPDLVPSYLFGALNVADDRISALSPAVEDALSKSRRIALESDIISANRLEEVMGVMGSAVLLPKGKKLDAVVPAVDVNRIIQAAKRKGIDPDVAARLRPFVASLLLSTSDCQQQRASIGKGRAFDSYLAAYAEERGIGTFGLESLDMLMVSMSKVPEASQNALLRSTLKGYERADDVTETLVQLYLKNDIAGLHSFHVALARANGATEEAIADNNEIMIYERNLRMRDRSMMHIAYGGVFIAVNAIHLPGKSGLIDLFRDAGYKVTEIE